MYSVTSLNFRDDEVQLMQDQNMRTESFHQNLENTEFKIEQKKQSSVLKQNIPISQKIMRRVANFNKPNGGGGGNGSSKKKGSAMTKGEEE